MFVLQTISCATLAGLSVWWANEYLDGASYLGGFEFCTTNSTLCALFHSVSTHVTSTLVTFVAASGIVLFFRNYGTWFILLALFIPISLFVTLEVVRFIQVGHDVSLSKLCHPAIPRGQLAQC